MIDSQTLKKLKKLIGEPMNAHWEHLGYPAQAWIAGLCKIIDDAPLTKQSSGRDGAPVLENVDYNLEYVDAYTVRFTRR